jgi:hypothetical protein
MVDEADFTPLTADEQRKMLSDLGEMRKDQKNAIACLYEMIREVATTRDPILFAAFYVAEKDIIEERPVTLFYNTSDKLLRYLVDYTSVRLKKKAGLVNARETAAEIAKVESDFTESNKTGLEVAE